MASIFNSLHIGYSGLNAAQVGIDTTGHNIANAESTGYSRQRVITAAATPITTQPGQVGNGAQIVSIERIFDNFVFDRYTNLSSSKEFSDFEKKTLTELSSYFPEIDNVGIKADLNEFYNMWQTFADNPDNAAIKLALAKQTETLSTHITNTQSQVLSLQSQINTELGVNINEVNTLAKELATLNVAIDTAESDGQYSANDLRDKRNAIEVNMAKLIGSNVVSGQLTSNMQINSSSNTKTGSYTLSVNGFNIVDGNTFHPLKLQNTNNVSGFYSISYERQDGALIPLEEVINGGKIGSILKLRGGTVDTTSGVPTNGTLQKVVNELDAFAKGLIEATNNLYANTPTTSMTSNTLTNVSDASSILNSPLNVKPGSFDIIVHDIDGNETARRTININYVTTMSGVAGSNSIQGQIEAQVDDNGDGNDNNDIDNFINYNWAIFASGDNALELTMNPQSASKGYTFSIEDSLTTTAFASGSNFAGALGLSRFFDGDTAKNIGLNNALKTNPTLISSGYGSTAGDNRLALDMIQQQFENYDFSVANINYNSTTYGMFDIIATEVGTATNTAITTNDTVTAQFNSTEMEYTSVSKVAIDEEMTNLIRYPTSYGAAAKVITTIDQMMQTLLGIKQ